VGTGPAQPAASVAFARRGFDQRDRIGGVVRHIQGVRRPVQGGAEEAWPTGTVATGQQLEVLPTLQCAPLITCPVCPVPVAPANSV
jgi:hypothetical protein